MNFDFDPAKDAANRRKHGLSLDRARDFDWIGAVIEPDDRRDYGERRFRAYADMMEGCMAAFTLRNGVTRIISLRRANKREVKRHGRP